MAVGDIWKIRNFCYDLDQVGINVSYWEAALETGAGAAAADIAAAFATAMGPVYQGWLSAVSQYAGASAQRVAPTLGVEGVSSAGAGFGTAGTAVNPRQVSGLLSLYTAIANRHGRGRQYIPFPSKDWADTQGNINAGGTTALFNIGVVYAGTVVATSTDPVGTNTFRLTVRQKTITNIVYNPVLNVRSRDKFATQRRRGQYGRENPNPL